MELIIASKNLHKIREFRDIFKQIKKERVELLSLLDFPEYEPPEETGGTFQENALIKSKHAALWLRKRVISDDSGLVVPALEGAPGIYSRRYAGEKATDTDNRKKLLKAMTGFREEKRQAYFECSIALCSEVGEEKIFTGVCEGYLLTEERGNQGFGYDSLFVKHGYDKTFAELSESVKNRISHRYKAFEKLMTALHLS